MEEKIIDIFCDASIVSIPSGYIGCAGAIAVDRKTKSSIDSGYRVLMNTTNNNSEINGILCAVLLAYKYKDKYDTINILSDSKICVFGLTEWSKKWICNDRNTLYGTSGEVANQQIFIQIMNMISLMNLKIHFYHQKGHVKAGKYDRAIALFSESNHIVLDEEQARYVSYYNDMVDNTTRDILYAPGYKNVMVYQTNGSPVTHIYDKELMKLYYSLIERGNKNGF